MFVCSTNESKLGVITFKAVRFCHINRVKVRVANCFVQYMYIDVCSKCVSLPCQQ